MSERQTPEEKREAAAIRRRWITLGEILAVIAVLISGLTLWNSYSDRSADEPTASSSAGCCARKAWGLADRP
jgi:predicted negative regulator of RcsB-dependent stress response